jgi:ceramide glucosyltransferase
MTISDAILICLAFAASAHFVSIAVLILRPYFAPKPKATTSWRPPVTILRPACGIENNIEETLASAYAIDYPEYEIVFCVADPQDPVIAIIDKLIADHPHVPSRLLTGDDRISINPKLNNLVKGWREAKHEWIVMTDSNVLLSPGYIDDLVSLWRPDVGLVCSPPIGTRPEGVGAELECAFLNTYQGRWQLTADAFGIAFAQGKTLFWRRSDLDRAGGVAALGAEPAEDAAATKVVHSAGRKVRLVRNPYPQPLGYRSIPDIWKRQLRWARLRRATFPPLYALELASGGFLPLLAGIVLFLDGMIPGYAAIALFAGWYGAELVLAQAMKWPISPRIALLLLARDLALPVLWVAGWTGSTFVWRGNAMDMNLAGRPLVPLFRGPRTLAEYAAALRQRGARAFSTFRTARSTRNAPVGRGLRANPLRWSWKTGSKTR